MSDAGSTYREAMNRGAGSAALPQRAPGNLEVTIASGDALDVRRFHVSEKLSSLFEVQLVAVSANPDVDFEAIIGQPMSFTLRSGQDRVWTGVCNNLQQVAVEEGGLSTYELTLVPSLWLSTQRRNHRMFQQMSELDIALKLLGEWGVSPEKKLTGNYKKRKYRVQYGESDYTFLCRMLEDAGISFYFSGEGGESRLVLDDGPQRNAPRAPIAFRDRPTVADREHVTHLRVGRQVRPGKYTVRDHDYRRPPSYNLIATASSAADVEDQLEQFRYDPGAFLFESDKGESSPNADDKGKYRTDEAEGSALAQRRLDAERGSARVVSFETNTLDPAPGVVLSFLEHPRADLGAGRLHLVTESALSGTHAGEWTHACVAVSAEGQYRPPLVTPKPRAAGVESATVVGPAGEEIHTDEFGRVRVHFHWDRESSMNDRSSCWIHVSQPWGGAGFGGTNLPRVGQEVIVDFLGGDPDRPIILGRVYTGLQKTPYKLPDSKTQSGWQSRSSPGGDGSNYNELMFEDKKGQELLRMQAEKDLHKVVKNDEQHRVGRDRSRHVKRNETVTIGKNRTKRVVQNEKQMVGVNQSVTIGVNRSTHVGVTDSTTAGNTHVVTISALSGGGTTSALMTHEKIVFDTGAGARLVMEHDKISIEAKTIEIAAKTLGSLSSMGALNIDGVPVTINGPGFPSARMTDPVGGTILAGSTTVFVGHGHLMTGLGSEIDALIADSPTLTDNLAKLLKDGWTLEYGEAGKGTYCDKDAKRIVVDPNERANVNDVVQSLSHESGHARYKADPYVPPDGLTRKQYIDANVNSSLKDEGEATLMNTQVRAEILKNGGSDIGIAGNHTNEYDAVYKKYPNIADRDKARQEIGDIFADGEHPSTAPKLTYRQYYGKGLEDFWDKNVKKTVKSVKKKP